MNIINMISEVDPYTLEHVNKSIIEGYHSGELHISLANSDDTVDGWWSLNESATKGVASIKFDINDIETLEQNYKSIQ